MTVITKENILTLLSPAVISKAQHLTGISAWSTPFLLEAIPARTGTVYIIETYYLRGNNFTPHSLPRVWLAIWWEDPARVVWGTNLDLIQPENLAKVPCARDFVDAISVLVRRLDNIMEV